MERRVPPGIVDLLRGGAFLVAPAPGVAVCDLGGGKNPDPSVCDVCEVAVVAGVADKRISNSARNSLFCFLDAYS